MLAESIFGSHLLNLPKKVKRRSSFSPLRKPQHFTRPTRLPIPRPRLSSRLAVSTSLGSEKRLRSRFKTFGAF